MSTYVMSDIHGCYDDMMKMLKLIEFTDEDTLIIAGDYIDRGPQSFEMLKWISNTPENVILLMGNHEQEFVYEVTLMADVCVEDKLKLHSLQDTKKVFFKLAQASGGVFDYYGTIQTLIEIHDCTLKDLIRFGALMEQLPYFHILEIGGRKCVVVHAGYTESLDGLETEKRYESLDDFYLLARDDAYTFGGIEHGMVIAGHTPTTIEDELPYNNGDVFVCYDEEIDCTFYDIDCGCSARGIVDNAKLACIRLEDEKIFYV